MGPLRRRRLERRRPRPRRGRPGALAHFDLESMKVSEVFSEFDDGAFPSPPTFVRTPAPRTRATAMWWCWCTATATKQLAVFDAPRNGPLAVASAPGSSRR
ncbi:MAG: hypothetical protein R2699_09240 [Acidimicrobiales bacterium]